MVLIVAAVMTGMGVYYLLRLGDKHHHSAGDVAWLFGTALLEWTLAFVLLAGGLLQGLLRQELGPNK